MTDDARDYLIRQFDTAWMLTSFHLDGLTTQECLWRPAREGLHVHQDADGRWRADWPSHERYDLGPPSIAWLTWHLGFWWSMVLDHSFGAGTLAREDVTWPGSANDVRDNVTRLKGEWQSVLSGVSGDDLRSTARTRWPFKDRPFGDVVAWANIELTKNAAEIGYARFLYAVSASTFTVGRYIFPPSDVFRISTRKVGVSFFGSDASAGVHVNVSTPNGGCKAVRGSANGHRINGRSPRRRLNLRLTCGETRESYTQCYRKA